MQEVCDISEGIIIMFLTFMDLVEKLVILKLKKFKREGCQSLSPEVVCTLYRYRTNDSQEKCTLSIVVAPSLVGSGGHLYTFCHLFLPDIFILKLRFNNHVCEADFLPVFFMQQDSRVLENLCHIQAIQ